MEKKFSKIQIAAIKRTAQNVAQFVTKKERIDAKIAALEAEKASYQPMIDAFQGPIKEMTGGYTTEDLVCREVVHTGKIDSKTGKEILQTRYVLKYPETVIPPVFETDEVPTTAEGPGSDFDIDRDTISSSIQAEEPVEEAEVEEVEDDMWS